MRESLRPVPWEDFTAKWEKEQSGVSEKPAGSPPASVHSSLTVWTVRCSLAVSFRTASRRNTEQCWGCQLPSNGFIQPLPSTGLFFWGGGVGSDFIMQVSRTQELSSVGETEKPRTRWEHLGGRLIQADESGGQECARPSSERRGLPTSSQPWAQGEPRRPTRRAQASPGAVWSPRRALPHLQVICFTPFET